MPFNIELQDVKSLGALRFCKVIESDDGNRDRPLLVISTDRMRVEVQWNRPNMVRESGPVHIDLGRWVQSGISNKCLRALRMRLEGVNLRVRPERSDLKRNESYVRSTVDENSSRRQMIDNEFNACTVVSTKEISLRLRPVVGLEFKDRAVELCAEQSSRLVLKEATENPVSPAAVTKSTWDL